MNLHMLSKAVSVGTCSREHNSLVFSHLKTYSKPVFLELVLFRHVSVLHFAQHI